MMFKVGRLKKCISCIRWRSLISFVMVGGLILSQMSQTAYAMGGLYVETDMRAVRERIFAELALETKTDKEGVVKQSDPGDKVLTCKIQEHTHTDACYRISESNARLDCPYITIYEDMNNAGHTHTEKCFDAAGNVICKYVAHAHISTCKMAGSEYACGYAAYVLHKHGNYCYNDRGELLCSLGEYEPHTHTDGCYTDVVTYADESTKSTESHIHTPECYRTDYELICSDEHVHTDGCYRETKTLICTQEENGGHKKTSQSTDKILTCGKYELILHTHNRECFSSDKNGNLYLSCKKTELKDHVHTKDCLSYDKIKILTCKQAEHVHDASCYAQREDAPFEDPASGDVREDTSSKDSVSGDVREDSSSESSADGDVKEDGSSESPVSEDVKEDGSSESSVSKKTDESPAKASEQGIDTPVTDDADGVNKIKDDKPTGSDNIAENDSQPDLMTAKREDDPERDAKEQPGDDLSTKSADSTVSADADRFNGDDAGEPLKEESLKNPDKEDEGALKDSDSTVDGLHTKADSTVDGSHDGDSDSTVGDSTVKDKKEIKEDGSDKGEDDSTLDKASDSTDKSKDGNADKTAASDGLDGDKKQALLLQKSPLGAVAVDPTTKQFIDAHKNNPSHLVQIGSIGGSEVKVDEMVPQKYSFLLGGDDKCFESVEVFGGTKITKNASNWGNSWDSNHLNESDRPVKADKTAKDGNYYAVYKKAGTYNGRSVDVKVSVMDFSLNANEKSGTPTIGLITKDKIGIAVIGADWIELKYEFFDSETGELIEVYGNTTYQDVDLCQGVFYDTPADGYIATAGSDKVEICAAEISGQAYVFSNKNYNDITKDERYTFSEYFHGTSITRTYTFSRPSDGGKISTKDWKTARGHFTNDAMLSISPAKRYGDGDGDGIPDYSSDTLVKVGDELTYELTWSWNEDKKGDLTLYDTLSKGLDFVDVKDGDIKPTSNTKNEKDGTTSLVWELGKKEKGDNGTITYVVKVNEEAFTLDKVNNKYEVEYSTSGRKEINTLENPIEHEKLPKTGGAGTKGMVNAGFLMLLLGGGALIGKRRQGFAYGRKR